MIDHVRVADLEANNHCYATIDVKNNGFIKLALIGGPVINSDSARALGLALVRAADLTPEIVASFTRYGNDLVAAESDLIDRVNAVATGKVES